jgi:two-component system, NtrC family, response regulator AlgB
MANFLIVDGGNRKIWKRLGMQLQCQGHRVRLATSNSPALRLLARDEFHVVAVNSFIAERNYYEFLREVKGVEPDAVIVVTAEVNRLQLVSDALTKGGSDLADYVTKLWPAEHIEETFKRAIELQKTRVRNRLLREGPKDCLFFQSRSPLMRRLLEDAKQAAASDKTILLFGESGTGKTLLARQMHLWSSRRAKPFLSINCASLALDRMETELPSRTVKSNLTKYKKGFSQIGDAEGGTLFLEDVADLSPTLQLALVGLVQDGVLETNKALKTYDVRIIVATSHDLMSEIAARRFREDLFYTLNIVSLHVPSLRERAVDIRPLARRMLAADAFRNHRGDLHISDEAAEVISSYRWPGNVRELRNAMEAAAVLCATDTITVRHLPESISKHKGIIKASISSRTSLDEIEREHIARVLANSQTLEDAATTLGINISTLWRKRKRYKLDHIQARKFHRTL